MKTHLPPAQFSSCFRNAVILSSLDSDNSGKNCIDDTDMMLLRHEDIQASQLDDDTELIDCGDIITANPDVTASPTSSDYVTYDLNDVMGVVTNTTVIEPIEAGIDNTVEIYTEAEEALICYLAGWLVRKCAICRDCQDVLTKPASEHSYCRRPVDLFIDKKRFQSSGSVGLIEPCDQLIDAVHRAEEVFRSHYERCKTSQNLCETLYNAAFPLCDFSFLFHRHPEHALYLSQKVIRLYMVMRIFYAIKFNNRNLTRFGKPKVASTVKRVLDGRKMQKIMHL